MKLFSIIFIFIFDTFALAGSATNTPPKWTPGQLMPNLTIGTVISEYDYASKQSDIMSMSPGSSFVFNGCGGCFTISYGADHKLNEMTPDGQAKDNGVLDFCSNLMRAKSNPSGCAGSFCVSDAGNACTAPAPPPAPGPAPIPNPLPTPTPSPSVSYSTSCTGWSPSPSCPSSCGLAASTISTDQSRSCTTTGSDGSSSSNNETQTIPTSCPATAACPQAPTPPAPVMKYTCEGFGLIADQSNYYICMPDGAGPWQSPTNQTSGCSGPAVSSDSCCSIYCY